MLCVHHGAGMRVKISFTKPLPLIYLLTKFSNALCLGVLIIKIFTVAKGSCSATYETLTQKQVVYEWFSISFPTNIPHVTYEGSHLSSCTLCRRKGRGGGMKMRGGSHQPGSKAGDPAI